MSFNWQRYDRFSGTKKTDRFFHQNGRCLYLNILMYVISKPEIFPRHMSCDTFDGWAKWKVFSRLGQEPLDFLLGWYMVVNNPLCKHLGKSSVPRLEHSLQITILNDIYHKSTSFTTSFFSVHIFIGPVNATLLPLPGPVVLFWTCRREKCTYVLTYSLKRHFFVVGIKKKSRFKLEN